MNVSTLLRDRHEIKKGRDKDSLASTPTTETCLQSDPIHTSPDKSCCIEVSDILFSIDNNLSGLDARIALVEVLHKELQLEFSQEQLTILAKENKDMKETILDLQSHITRDNLDFFSGIQQRTHDDNPEQLINEFMTTHLQISLDTVNHNAFHRVHRIEQNK